VKQEPAARLRHWQEYEQLLSDACAGEQARRCMDCGTPGCHSQCPVHNLIPDWNLLVADADWAAAWEQLDSTNNFPEFTGRICGAPCEPACTLSINSRPVTIRCIELAIAEYAWRTGRVRPQRSTVHRFQRVAVIGSGPAGLACAQQLVRAGYRVTVYEQADRVGGLLRYGIPDFRLEKTVLDRRLAQLEAEGVSFRTGTRVGGVDLAALRRSAHAVVLATGAETPRDLDVPGRRLPGVHFAMDYLVQQNRRLAGDRIAAHTAISAAGRRVAVIGGGDTGGDCVGTALRQGAAEVIQIQYHDRPPAHVDNLLYWPAPVPEWHATDHDAEGCRRIWGFDTVACEGGREGVSGLVLQRLEWRCRPDGVRESRRVPGRRVRLPVQLVLLALGYRHTRHDGLLATTGVRLDGRGNIAAGTDGYHTNVPGVFACGDARRGQSLVVWAIREGRQCARAVDIALGGDSQLPAL
jgi:glutamate synthase (NADPH/NADH) small chain